MVRLLHRRQAQRAEKAGNPVGGLPPELALRAEVKGGIRGALEDEHLGVLLLGQGAELERILDAASLPAAERGDRAEGTQKLPAPGLRHPGRLCPAPLLGVGPASGGSEPVLG